MRHQHDTPILLRKSICILLLFLGTVLNASVRMVVWNIQNMGRSKDAMEIKHIAETLKSFDVVGIVEVVAGDGGAQSVGRLADQLNRTGAAWDYCISDPTSSEHTGERERYAFLWKKSKVKRIGKAVLEPHLADAVSREPYMATFEAEGKLFSLLIFHAVPKSKQPETEIKHLKHIPELYPNIPVIMAGDFNCPGSHTVYIPLQKSGYAFASPGQKTSLRRKCDSGDCLASEYDHILYPSAKIRRMQAGILPFYKGIQPYEQALKISDHVPVWMEFSIP